ncbi:hypothetical protein TrRE_jg9991 [Triparma retinervis]|uniref:Uncharacterized protein n=1 Tax=Triparma retinervis TaxID=2557542 RepID=A0A9W7A6M3_9STRA|nr:hypothetical protein TrRE_jg9991 [Triparma retinervis]
MASSTPCLRSVAPLTVTRLFEEGANDVESSPVGGLLRAAPAGFASWEDDIDFAVVVVKDKIQDYRKRISEAICKAMSRRAQNNVVCVVELTYGEVDPGVGDEI